MNAISLLAVSTIFLLVITNTSFGKSLRAIRDNESYASARGISISRQRIIALVASAIFTGIAGSFYVTYLRVASLEVFGFGTLSLALSMVLIGGIGTIWGPAIAGIALIFATELLAGIRGMEEARFIIVAIVMILVLIRAPGGLSKMLSKL